MLDTAVIPAFDTINQLQDEIIMSANDGDYEDADGGGFHQRQQALISILARAKPLTGQGYFLVDKPMVMSIIGASTTYIIVLLQFSLAE